MSSPKNDSSATNTSWRSSVAQSVRNQQVREIAQVLADLEAGASTSSKLRLAMQFEDTIFKSSDSLADYHKRLAKRLKKVQKSYVPTAPAAPASDAQQREQDLIKLKALYGPSLLYILENAEKAVAEMKVKYGDEKSQQLKLHTDGVKLWASDLGVISNGPNFGMSAEHFEKLQNQLERRVDNIRSHVVKLADPDKFLLETLQKTEQEYRTGIKHTTDNSSAADKGQDNASDSKISLSKASRILAVDTRKRYEQIQKDDKTDPLTLFQSAFAQAQATVPVPTRQQRDDEKTALIHLDKLRAAATAVMGYMMVHDKASLPTSMFTKVHQISHSSVPFVQQVVKDHRKRHDTNGKVRLQDAWIKSGELLDKCSNIETESGAELPPPKKKARLSLSVKVLLTAGRKTPPNLLPALRRKRVTLVRPPPKGQGSYLILYFEKAFVMCIYLKPLLVTIRAFDEDDTSKSSPTAGELQCATWMPLQQGLVDSKTKLMSNASKTSTTNTATTRSEAEQPFAPLKVWGVSGTYDTIGHVVEERLRDASANATHALRKCFSRVKSSERSIDFDIEIREATVLLEFIQAARTTYIPDWQDDYDV